VLTHLCTRGRADWHRGVLQGDRPDQKRRPRTWNPATPAPEHPGFWLSGRSGSDDGRFEALSVLQPQGPGRATWLARSLSSFGPHLANRAWAELIAEACETLITRDAELTKTGEARLRDVHALLCADHRLTRPELPAKGPLPGPVRLPATAHDRQVRRPLAPSIQRVVRNVREDQDEQQDALGLHLSFLKEHLQDAEDGYVHRPATFRDEAVELNLEAPRMLEHWLRQADLLEPGTFLDLSQNDSALLLPWESGPLNDPDDDDTDDDTDETQQETRRPATTPEPRPGPRGTSAPMYQKGRSLHWTDSGEDDQERVCRVHRQATGLSLELLEYPSRRRELYRQALTDTFDLPDFSLPEKRHTTPAWPLDVWLSALHPVEE